MRRTIILSNLSPWSKLLFLIGLIILSSLLFALLGLLIGKLYLGTDLETLASYIARPETDEAIVFVKLYQFINQLGVFFLPVLVFSFFVSKSVPAYLSMNKNPGFLALLIGGLIIYTVLPFNHYLIEINQKLNLPGMLSGIEDWIQEYEQKAEILTASFLKTDSIGVLTINLFIVALVPAIGEEWLFRGVLLKLFRQITGNHHWAILISAFLFAALHLQFLSFLPRFFLGIILGYMLIITGNLWVPIFAHFVNNASSVIVFYLHHNGYISVPLDEFGSSGNTVYITGSFLITLWLLFVMNRRTQPT